MTQMTQVQGTDAPTRTLVFDLDSLNQRDRWIDGLAPQGRPTPLPAMDVPTEAGQISRSHIEWFGGVLRTTTLLSDDLLVPYNQLLDGVLFSVFRPEGVRELLSLRHYEKLSITVGCPDEHLGETLRSLIVKDGQDHLDGFQWSCLTMLGIDPVELIPRVTRRSADRLRGCPVEDVPYVLAAELESAHSGREVTTPRAGFRRLADGWSQWTEEVSSGAMSSTRMPLSGNVAGWIARSPSPTFTGVDSPEHADQLARLVTLVRGSTGRSVYVKHLRSARASAEFSAVTEQNVATLNEWWRTAYYTAMAESGQARWVEYGAPVPHRAPASLDSLNARLIRFDGYATELVGSMPPSVYEETLFRVRDVRSRWIADPSQIHADDLGYAIVQSTATIERRDMRRGTLRRIALALGTAIIGAVTAALTDQTRGIAAVVLSGFAILLATPMLELIELRRSSARHLHTVIGYPQS